MYLNQVYWGHNAYGIESASQLYFGKNAQNLTLAESAVLVGMLKVQNFIAHSETTSVPKGQKLF